MPLTSLLRQPRFYLYVLLALLAAALIGALTALFWELLHFSTHLIWEVLPHQFGLDSVPPLYTLAVCLLGGLLIGLTQRYLGDHPKDIKTELAEFQEHGRFDTAHIPHGMAASLISLAAGGSLGPESPLMAVGGGLSTAAADAIAHLTGHRPRDWAKPIARLHNLIVIAIGLVAFIAVALAVGILGNGGLFNPALYQFHLTHLLWAIPAAAIGIAAGYLFLAVQRGAGEWAAYLGQSPVRRGVVSGLLFGLIAIAFPLTLFSGQENLPELQAHAADLPLHVLLLSGLMKLFAVALLLNAGWKGGTFLPLMTAAALLGLPLSLAVPGLPTLVPMVAAMAGPW